MFVLDINIALKTDKIIIEVADNKAIRLHFFIKSIAKVMYDKTISNEKIWENIRPNSSSISYTI